MARTIEEVRRAVGAARREGRVVGLVPTLGALHAGHFSLIERAREECGLVVVSIFVNPTQFGPDEDFERYPRPFEKDVAGCEGHGVDVVFAPEAAEMYPEGFCTEVQVKGLGSVLEGEFRPAHFAGVCTVVLKLLQIVQPEVAYFGEKDYQQLVILEQMVRDLNVPVRIVGCATVREQDGMALSSRNAYLSAEERARGLAIAHGLRAAEAAWKSGERRAETLCALVRQELQGAELEIDYVAAAEPETLKPVEGACGKCVLLVAGRAGRTRLLDNVILSPEV